MYSARLQECKSPRISLNKQRKCETSRASEPMFHTPLQPSRFNPHLALGTALSILLAAKTTCHDLRIDGHILQDSSTLGLMSFYHRGKWRENPLGWRAAGMS